MFKLLKSTILGTALALCTVAGASADTGLMKKFEDFKWTSIPDTPLSFSIIWGDRNTGPYAMYLKLPGGGFSAGTHAHTYSYHGITIQGEWEHEFAGEKKVLPLGSYVNQPGNAFHGDRCVSKEDCVLLIIQDGKGDAIFPHEHK